MVISKVMREYITSKLEPETLEGVQVIQSSMPPPPAKIFAIAAVDVSHRHHALQYLLLL
jgi:hypothetical protein